jgi:hypothetical protein
VSGYEEVVAEVSTEGLQSFDHTCRVFWNDTVFRYVVAQDHRRTVLHKKPWKKIDADRLLCGISQLKREFPNGLSPYESLLLLDRGGEPAPPQPGMIFEWLEQLAPRQDAKLNADKLILNDEKRHEEALNKDWQESFGEDAVSKDLEENRRDRKYTYSKS